MAPEDLVRMVPIITGRDLAPMVAFYERLGLQVVLDHGDYMILTSAPTDAEAAGVELHLSAWAGHDPRTTAGSVYLLVRDARALWQELHDALVADGTLYRAPASGLTGELVAELRAREDAGEVLTRLHDVEDKPWGLCEFGVIDPAGTLVRVASILR
jgi:hypothetical protein